MELRQYALLVRKWLWLIVVCTAVAGAAAYLVSKRSTPIYQAAAVLLVNQTTTPEWSTAYADILTNERLARTYANLLTSQPVLEGTAGELGIEPKAIAGMVSVSPIRDTQLLDLKVEGPDRKLITEIANRLPVVFSARNQQMQTGLLGESKASLEREMANVEADLARTQAALEKTTEATERIRLETLVAQYRSTYSNLVHSFQQIKLAEVQSANNLIVAAPATVPESPIRPRTMTNTLLAAVVGAMIAVGAAFLIEYLDDTVKSPDDVRRVSGLATLGAIARVREAGDERRLITWSQSKAPEAEAYRTLRTNIQFSSVDKPVRTLLVTSSGPSEGKSTTAANLAVVMAQTGQRVALVDTDLRRPVLHRVFSLPNNVGLTTALLPGEDVSVDGRLQPTQVENLWVLTSGPVPPNPSELLGSQRMATLVGKLLAVADLVIFDSPPVLAVTDAAVLGRQVDGVVIVVDAGQTREPGLAQAADEMRKTGANVLGVALNRLDSRSGGYYYYYYYYNYSYSGDGAGQRKRAALQDGIGDRLRLSRLRKPSAN